MPDVIVEYQKWKEQGESLRTQARQAMEARFRALLTEAAHLADEYRVDFGGQLKPPANITAFRFKSGAKPKKAAPKKAAAPAPPPPGAEIQPQDRPPREAARRRPPEARRRQSRRPAHPSPRRQDLRAGRRVAPDAGLTYDG